MFKRKKKKIGCKTPEFRRLIAPRAYKLNHGDVFVLNDVGIQQTFNLSVKDMELGIELRPGIICIQKIKRKYWWQFWKPKYWGAKFMYVEKDLHPHVFLRNRGDLSCLKYFKAKENNR